MVPPSPTPPPPLPVSNISHIYRGNHHSEMLGDNECQVEMISYWPAYRTLPP